MIRAKLNWKVKYEHDKAVRDSQCASLGIEIPDDEDGQLTIKKEWFTRHMGKEFWEEMKKRGHSSADFASCNCWREKNEQ